MNEIVFGWEVQNGFGYRSSWENAHMNYLIYKWCLTLSQTKKKLDTFKLKEFADDNFKLDENGRKFSEWVENAVGKGEIACYARFVLSIAIVAKCNKKI